MSDIYDLGAINSYTVTDLFNGSAGTANNTSPLNDSITNYKFLVVFTCVNNGTYSYSNKQYTVIEVADILGIPFEHRIYQNNGSALYSIGFHFNISTNDFTIDSCTISTTSWNDARIYKIIGLK